ncbi:hypothetical protein AGR3A_Cc190132 [Agrobacterium tomkonis CFBP 6623]|uniref:Uncharacterized protein n=1 Tax=Agrobacterium tomkonis CFBP 6623 TaxID=1183432 RepID=A0A1S7P2C7_9HYPH|nr:hypothetical protein AGR3A_Cc190132 [Agrobacterium tomkonis CFBP 6623]
MAEQRDSGILDEVGTRAIEYRYRKFNFCLEATKRTVEYAALPTADLSRKGLVVTVT